MRSGRTFRYGIQANPAETKCKRTVKPGLRIRREANECAVGELLGMASGQTPLKRIESGPCDTLRSFRNVASLIISEKKRTKKIRPVFFIQSVNFAALS